MIIYRRRRFVPPPLITGIERVTNMKILGVVVGCDLRARLHISDTLGACSRSLYALRVLERTVFHQLPYKRLLGQLLWLDSCMPLLLGGVLPRKKTGTDLNVS